MATTNNQKIVVAVVYVTAMFMAVLDTTIINMALPAIGRELHVELGGIGLVSAAYLISLTVFIPASGWLGDRVGGRTALLSAVALFTGASLLCGLASDIDQLLAFRILQGIGGAVMTPVGLAMLFRTYQPHERIRISSMLAAVTALAPALGPILGGLFTTYFSWRYVFWVNVPIGFAELIYGFNALDDHRTAPPGRVDMWSLGLSGGGLGALVYGFSKGPSEGWLNANVLATTIIGALMLVALVLVELRTRTPLIELRLLRNRLFASATSIYGLGSVAYLGALFLISLFLQDALGLSAVRAGFTSFPSALGTLLGGQLVTRLLYNKLGPRRVIVIGLVAVAAAMTLMADVDTSTSLWCIRLIMFIFGLGISFAFITAQAVSMASICKTKTGKASAIFNTAKQLGGALGVSLLSTIIAIAKPPNTFRGGVTTQFAAYHVGFLVSAIVACFAAFIAITVRDADAIATNRPSTTAPLSLSTRNKIANQ